MGPPNDFTRLVANLYSGASTEFVNSPTDKPHPWGSGGEPSRANLYPPLLFDLMIAPSIRFLTHSNKGYEIAVWDLKLVSKWYADACTHVTNSVEDMISLLDIVVQYFSSWSGIIHLNVAKCKITA